MSLYSGVHFETAKRNINKCVVVCVCVCMCVCVCVCMYVNSLRAIVQVPPLSSKKSVE